MMGSKMASASRVIQVIKPHTPLIRFPDRRDNPKPNISEALRSRGLPSHSSAISQHSRGSKSPDLLITYRRKSVAQEEIKFIQRGGPE
uniref:28S ribosomal protein S36, mitochondrial n=1 Tax=Propithecus coquereli TaxID=379532 RepID=A0A2K6GMF5_PROCO